MVADHAVSVIDRLKSEIAQGWVIVGTATQRPVILAFALSDWQVIDAGDAQVHQAVLIEFLNGSPNRMFTIDAVL